MLSLIKQYGALLLGVLFIISLGTTAVLINITKNQKEEISRLSSNQSALNDSVIFYKTKSGRDAASVSELIYSVNELKKYERENVALIKDLGLKINQVQNIVNTGIVTVVRDTIPLRDSIFINNDTIKCFNKADDYLKLTGCIPKNSNNVNIDLQMTDTISSVAHYNYKKWFIFKCRDKNSISLETTNKSPYTKITYSKSIKIQ